MKNYDLSVSAISVFPYCNARLPSYFFVQVGCVLVKRSTALVLLVILALALPNLILPSLAKEDNRDENIVTVISVPLDLVPKRVIVGCNGTCIAIVYGVEGFEGFDLYVFNSSGSPRWVGGIRARLPWYRVFVGSSGIYILRHWVYNYNASERIGLLTLYLVYTDLHYGRIGMQVYTIVVRDAQHVKQVGIVYAVGENIYIYVDLGIRGVKLYMLGKEHVYSVSVPTWKTSWEHVSGWNRVLLLGNHYVVFGNSNSLYSLPKVGGRHISCGVGQGGLLICYTTPTIAGNNYSVNVYAIDPISQVIVDSEILTFKVRPSCHWREDGKFLVCIGDSIYLISNSKDGLQVTKYKFDNKIYGGNLLAVNLLPFKRLYLVFAGNKSIIHPKLAGTQGLVLVVADEKECWVTTLWPNSRILADSVYMADDAIGVAILGSGRWEVVVKKLPSSPPKRLVRGNPETVTLYITVTETLVKASVVTVTETETKTMFTTTTLYHTITRSKTVTRTVTSWKTLTATKTVTQPVTTTITKVKLLTTTETKIVVPLDAWKAGIGALIAGLLAGYIVARRSAV